MCVCVCAHTMLIMQFTKRRHYILNHKLKNHWLDASHRQPVHVDYINVDLPIKNNIRNNGDLKYCAAILLMYSLQSHQGKLSATSLLLVVLLIICMCYFEKYQTTFDFQVALLTLLKLLIIWMNFMFNYNCNNLRINP